MRMRRGSCIARMGVGPRDSDLVESELRKLETDLLRGGVRHSPEALSFLLAEEFCEFGSSGRILTKQETIDALATEAPVSFSVTDFSVTILAPCVALVKYQAARHDESGQVVSMSLRSSLWVLRNDRWQMLFHQGTKVSE
jgi:hypothetical protein